MDKEAIGRAIEDLYAARLSNNPSSCAAGFSEDASFRLAGSSDTGNFALAVQGQAELKPALCALVDTWTWTAQEINSVLIDGSEAAVRYRLTTTHVPTGKSVETECMDHLVFDENLKVCSMVEFVDTAMVEHLSSHH